jgi:rubrerythrin
MVSEQSQTVEAVKTAIQMEIDGRKFYQQAGRASQNELGQKLFRQLASEEDLHRRKFEEIFKAIQTSKAWPAVELTPHEGKELETLFARAGKSVKASSSELEAVQTAMTMENRTRDFYRERAGKASFETEKRYYQTLEKEEAAHHAALLDYYEYMKDPAGWFTIKERHSLDGG